MRSLKILSAITFLGSFAIAGMASHTTAQAQLNIYDYKVVKSYPHDDDAFTQGLIYLDGYLYESTGKRTRSSLRKVELETGKVLQQHNMDDIYFGEGIVDWNDQIIGITWQENTGFVFDRSSFSVESTFGYTGEGWGLTRDDSVLYMSDGTHQIRVLDPKTQKELRRFDVTLKGQPLAYLNELEWVEGQIFANLYGTDLIARINPKTGVVEGVINLANLLPAEDFEQGHTGVLNGIAYDSATKRLFVTGKQWPTLFEIELVKR